MGNQDMLILVNKRERRVSEMEKVLREHMEEYMMFLQKRYQKEYQRGRFEENLSGEKLYNMVTDELLKEYNKEKAKVSGEEENLGWLWKIARFPDRRPFPSDIELVYVSYEEFYDYASSKCICNKGYLSPFRGKWQGEAFMKPGNDFIIEVEETANRVADWSKKKMKHQAEIKIDRVEEVTETGSRQYHGICKIEGYAPFECICEKEQGQEDKMKIQGRLQVEKDHPRWKEFYKWKEILIRDHEKQIEEWTSWFLGK